jgi:hypothetical protein
LGKWQMEAMMGMGIYTERVGDGTHFCKWMVAWRTPGRECDIPTSHFAAPALPPFPLDSNLILHKFTIVFRFRFCPVMLFSSFISSIFSECACMFLMKLIYDFQSVNLITTTSIK